jgi:hypothetical protein
VEVVLVLVILQQIMVEMVQLTQVLVEVVVQDILQELVELAALV